MRKAIRNVMLIVLLLLTVAGIGIVWLCYTASGLQFALEQLNHVPNLTVQVQGVSGRLAGPLHVDHLRLEHERVAIDIDRIDVDFTPALLLSGLVEIDHLQIGTLQVGLKPRTREVPEAPIRFLPAFLRISVDQLDLQHGEYLHTNGYQIVATPLHASVDLSRTELEVTHLDAVTRDYDARGSVTLEADEVLNLLADVDATYRINNGPALRGMVKADGPVTGTAPALTLAVQLREPHDAQLNGVLAFPASGWSVQGDATAQQVLLDAWWPQPAFSLKALAAHFDLSNAGMRYSGTVVVPQWSPAQLLFAADTQYAQRVFTMRRVDIAVPATGVQVVANGSITLNEGRKPLVDMQGNWRSLRWPLHARDDSAYFISPLGQMTLRGEQPYAFTMSGDVRTPQWPLSTVRANGELRPGEVQLKDFLADTLQGRATGSAVIGFAEPRNWQFRLRGSNLNPGELFASWPGTLNIEAQGKGRGFDKNAQFDVQVRSLTGTMRSQALSVSGRLQRDASRWLADNIEARWGRARLAAQGVYGPQNNLSFTLNAPQLQQLHPDITGDVNLVGQIAGPAGTPYLKMNGQSTRMTYAGAEAQTVKLETWVDLTDGSDSHLELSAANVMNGATGMKNLLLKGDGRMKGHYLSLEGSPVNPWLPNDLQLLVYTGNTYQDGVWNGILYHLNVVDGEQNKRVSLQKEVPWHASTSMAQLEPLCVNVDNGKLCARMNWQRDADNQQTWNAHADIQDLPLWISNAALAPDTRLQAKLNGRLDFAATPTMPPQGSAELHLSDASIRYQSVTNREVVLPITLGELRVDSDAFAVLTTAELRLGEQTVATLTANLDRNGALAASAWPLSGVLSLSSSDAKLIPVFVNEVDRAHGTLAAIMQLSGTAVEPRLAGTVRLLDGELDFYRLNLALRSLQFDALVDTDQVQFTAQANAGEGLLNSSGKLNWQYEKLSGALQLKGERLLVADLPEYRVLASPDLRFDIKERNVSVRGEVLIPEARLQPKQVVGAVQTSADARFKTDEVLDDNSSPWTIDSDVSIRLGDKVTFDGLGLEGQLGGAVSTRLRTGEPAVGDGELSVNSGSYEISLQNIAIQKLDIKRGRLIYDNTPLGNPGLDIQAERKIEVDNTTVGVYVRGVLSEPRLQFYSEPSMSQTQIVSYLLLGKPLDDLQSGEAASVRSASNAMALKGGGFLAGQLGRYIGLEQVDVQTDANNQSSLVLGKFLSPRLFISYGISLTEAINTVKLRYALSDRWTIKTEAGEAQSADVEFKIER